MATQLSDEQAYHLKMLAKEQPRLNLLERYHDGDAPLPEGAEGQSRAYRRFQKKARLNLGQLAISAVRERMMINGFRTGADDDENGDAEARRLWKANNGDVKAADLHETMLKFGYSYVMVGFPEGYEYPIMTVEDPRQMHCMVDPIDQTTVTFALKVFQEYGKSYVYYYYGDRIEVFEKDADLNIYDPGAWMLSETRTVNNPLGQIPIVKFTNAGGLGEYEPYTDIIDRVNHMTLQRLVIATTQAFRQRVLRGEFPTHDQDGNEIDYNGILESSAGALWMIPEGADVTELGQSDMSGILQAVRADIQDFAAVTRTPMHYFHPDAANGSAEGASLAREGLVFKAEDRINRVTPGWSKAMSLMFRWVGDEERASLLDLEPMWQRAERYSLAERADANAKFQDIPFRQRMSLIGQFPPGVIDEMEVERRGEQVFTSAITG